MGMLEDLQKQGANIAAEKALARIKQQPQRTFSNDNDYNKKHLSRQASSIILLTIVVVIIVGIAVAVQFLH